MADVEFYWDPICPYAWVASRWVDRVAELGGHRVDWRFISLRIVNERRDYERDLPPGYADLHERGLRMLRVAAAARAAHGREAMGPLYRALGHSIWERAPEPGRGALEGIGHGAHLAAALAAAGLPGSLAVAADDPGHDDDVRRDGEAALERAGSDLGTPVVVIDPPEGPGFFGPVISRVPDDAEALELWDAVCTLARWRGFFELKRARRDLPQVPLLLGAGGGGSHGG